LKNIVMRLKIFVYVLLTGLMLPYQGEAGEGMWSPVQLHKVIEQMHSMGLEIDKEDIYSAGEESINNAVVRIGGCTGVVVSGQGLVLTNHHCAYRFIQSISTTSMDYLSSGFWAETKEEEIPGTGLTATFLVRMENVTDRVLKHVDDHMEEDERRDTIRRVSAEIEREATEGTRYEASVDSYYYGNEFYLSVYDKYDDVRLVGAPPSSVGRFGRDEDNWMWPRHTGDFTFFRIYADGNNEPAAYDSSNVPYEPFVHIPLSKNHAEVGDFTMVYGYPGSTEFYITSDGIRITRQISNPHKIGLRGARLDAMETEMKKCEKVAIQYAAKFSDISNAWKRWQGENAGIDRFNVIERKKEIEGKFNEWAVEKPEREEIYSGLMDEFKELYSQIEHYTLPYKYMREGIFAVEVLSFAAHFADMVELYESGKGGSLIKYFAEGMIGVAEDFFEDYHMPVDRKVFTEMVGMYMDNVDREFHPGFFEYIEKDFDGDIDQYAEYLFENSIFVNEDKLLDMLEEFTDSSAARISEDPFMGIVLESADIYGSVFISYRELNRKTDRLYRLYMEGLRKMHDDVNFPPDANRTLRISYGKVKGYNPRDAVYYDYYTTLSGVMEKYRRGNDHYHVPSKLKELYEGEEYGSYSFDGEMRVCFIASNHTTGGSSGSPVFNARGHLVGLNFDRVWEGTMSDIMFDPAMSRNISVDVNYIMFITDIFAGAGHLLDEMTIVD